MMEIYRLRANVKAPNHYVCFSEGLQARLDEIVWVHPTRQQIDSRWIIRGKAQDGLTDAVLAKMDFVPGVSAIELFSARFVEKQFDEFARDVDFLPCTVVSQTGGKFQFYIARCHRFEEIIDLEKTDEAEKISPLAPIIFRRSTAKFFLARDVHRRTISVVSELFRNFCEENNFSLGFRHVDYDLHDWLSRQAR